MRIARLQSFTGPSIYARPPVVVFAVKGMARLRERIDQTLFDRLVSILPSLVAHECLAGFPDIDSASPDRRCNHLFAHVCDELQAMAGAVVDCGHSDYFELGRKNTVVVQYESVETAAVAAESAARSIDWALSDAPVDAIQEALQASVATAAAGLLPVQDRELIRRAHELDIPTYPISGRLMAFGQGRRHKRLSGTKTSLTSAVSNDLAANKDYSRKVLGALALPIPLYERVYGAAGAAAAARRIGFPVVVKPNNGGMGRGVSVGMKTSREVRDAYRRARKFGRSVLVEQLVAGADFRLLVINGDVRAAAKRVPGHVVGDGESTIAELLDRVNSDPRRGSGPMSSWTKISMDDQAHRLLADLGYNEQSVPAAGETVFLRRNANTSDGGTAVDVTDFVHPDNREVAVRAANAIGLDIAGVDVLSPDISVSMWDNGGTICEINSRPGLRKHIWPAEGQGRDVVTPILEMLFPNKLSSRVPVIAVLCEQPGRDTGLRIARHLAERGYYVGVSTLRKPSARMPSMTVLRGDQAIGKLTLDPRVEAIVLELDPQAVVDFGLDTDVVDISVLDGGHDQAIKVVEAAARVLARTTRGSMLIDSTSPQIELVSDCLHPRAILRLLDNPLDHLATTVADMLPAPGIGVGPR